MQLNNEMSQLLADRLALQPTESQTYDRLNASPHLTTIQSRVDNANAAENQRTIDPR